MAAAGDFQRQRSDTLDVIDLLMKHAGIKSVYYAGQGIRSVDSFEPQDVAAVVDLDAIRKSRFFLMLYPERVASSVLFEAGFALALGRPAVYLVRAEKDLPFLMQNAGNLSADYPRVKIYECADHAAQLRLIERAGKNLFAKTAGT